MKAKIHAWKGKRNVQECADNDPRKFAFGLYRRKADGTLEWISDHETRKAAEKVAKALKLELE